MDDRSRNVGSSNRYIVDRCGAEFRKRSDISVLAMGKWRSASWPGHGTRLPNFAGSAIGDVVHPGCGLRLLVYTAIGAISSSMMISCFSARR